MHSPNPHLPNPNLLPLFPSSSSPPLNPSPVPQIHEINPVNRPPLLHNQNNNVDVVVIDDDDNEDDEDDEEDRVECVDMRHKRFGSLVDENDEDEFSDESRGKRRRVDEPQLAPVAVPSFENLDCNLWEDWSEDETFLLIKVWDDEWVRNGKRGLWADEWIEVSERLFRVLQVMRTDAQCRNRVDELVEKYEEEIAKMRQRGSSKSDWVYFEKMDAILSLQTHMNDNSVEVKVRDNAGNDGADGDDGESKRGVLNGVPPRRERRLRGSKSSYKMLADSVENFNRVFVRIENRMERQMVELDRMRKEFHRDSEAHRKQILEKAQAEIASMREEESEAVGEEDKVDDNRDNRSGSAENLRRFLAGSFYMGAFG